MNFTKILRESFQANPAIKTERHQSASSSSILRSVQVIRSRISMAVPLDAHFGWL